MTSIRNLTAISGIALGLTAMSVPAANAQGFFGGLIEGACGNCGVGRALDRMNAQGHFFEHGVAAIANYLIPGSGVVLEGVWTAQDVRNAYENGQLSEEDAVAALAELGENLN